MVTQTELAILTLLAEQPRHGYDIEAAIEQRGMREWTDIGFSSIYYLLKKLEKEEYIRSQLQPAPQGPTRKVYSLTLAGLEVLREQARMLLSNPQRVPQPFLLGLANWPLLDAGEGLAALHSYRVALAEQREHILQRRDAQQPLPDFVNALFDYSLVSIDAQLRWLDDFITSQEQKNDGYHTD
jgi:DNA-binding PadR family transcriptional regulator